MSGTSIDIYLRTIATGDGAKMLARDLEQVNKAAERAAASQAKATSSGRNMGSALLQLSRGAQDAQYGLAGVVNNLEGLASALGLGAGVAGAVTLVAVLLQQLGPKLAEFFASLSPDKINAQGLKAFTDQLGLLSSAKTREQIASERLQQKIAAEKTAIENESEAIKAQLTLFNLRNAAAQGVAEFEAQTKIEDIKAQALPKDQEANAIAAVKLQLLQQQQALQEQAAAQAILAAEKEAANRAKAAAAAAAEVARLDEIINRSGELNRLKTQEAELLAKIDALQPGGRRGQDFATPGQEQALAAARAALGANQQAQARANIGGLADAQTQAQRDARFAESTSAAAAAAAAAQAAQRTRDEQTQRLTNTALQNAQQQAGLSRTLPGAPASPFGPAPLPTGQAFGAAPASPFGPAPLPQAGSQVFQSAPTAPFGGQALPQATAATEQLNASITTFAETVLQANEATRKRLAEVEAKLKASRSP